MTDVVDRATRSRMMSNIRGKNTKPELLIRKALHKKGLRYRLHVSHLPGKPDLVFSKYRAALFVNGCFWHGHDCKFFRLPSTRRDFWEQKINGNRERDCRHISALRASGWRTLIVWECVTRQKAAIPFDLLIDAIQNWLVTAKDPAFIDLGGIHVQRQD